MIVHIINGTYGYRPMVKQPDGSMRQGPYVVPTTSRDAPISVSDEEAQRLVNLGVAEYVGVLTADSSAVPSVPQNPEDNTPEIGDAVDAQNGAGNEPATEEEPAEEPEYSMEMSSADLRAAMEERGIPIRARMTKAQMVEALTEVPELTALDVVDE